MPQINHWFRFKEQKTRTLGAIARALFLLTVAIGFLPDANALPPFARQTGQRCAACHVGGNWPQLTPWGRFFTLAGCAAGQQIIGKEGINVAPIGSLGQAGLTSSAQPN